MSEFLYASTNARKKRTYFCHPFIPNLPYKYSLFVRRKLFVSGSLSTDLSIRSPTTFTKSKTEELGEGRPFRQCEHGMEGFKAVNELGRVKKSQHFLWFDKTGQKEEFLQVR